MINLREKIKAIIKRETENNHFCELNLDSSVELIQQIFENYEITNDLHQDFSNLPKKGELVILVAPTGAGKDGLVIRLNAQNPEKKYIELNMDMFRHYFPMFISDSSILRDKTFAKQTNEFSYEIFMTIQELLLNEFPGTNIIITGTLRETDWPQRIIENFKQVEHTDYKIKIASLAVPKKESALSVIKRYIEIIDDSNTRSDFQAGTERYTSLSYHDETYERFPENLKYFETLFKSNPGKLIDSMEVYRRTKSQDENNLVYSSDRPEDIEKTATDTISELRKKDFEITTETATYILQKVQKHSAYLKSQETFNEVIDDLGGLLRQSTFREVIEYLDNLIKSIQLLRGIENDYGKE